MRKKNFFTFSLIIVFALCSPVSAQVLDAKALESAKMFTDLNEALKTPDKVYKLDLADKNLTEIPASIGKLKKLQYFSCNLNPITKLPAELWTLSNLEVLMCSLTKLEKLPVEIVKLKNLKVLEFSENKNTTLPAEIGKLEKLEVLFVPGSSNNRLKSLPEEIGNLKNLKELRIADNKLTALPKSIVKLKKLEVLECMDNKIPSAQIEAIKQALPACEIKE